MLTAFVLRLCGAFEWTHVAMLLSGAVGIAQLALYLAGVRIVSRVLFVGLSIVFVPFGFVISHVLMIAVYYLVVTPIALAMRLLGRDVIGKEIDKSRASYWHERDGKRPAASYFKLY